MFSQSVKLTVAACLAAFFTATASGASQPPPVTPVLPNDPGRVQFPLVYEQIDAPNFWGATINKTCTVRLAVLDSGIAEIPDLSHVVLRANFAPGVVELPHGTWVASIAGATSNNGIGVAGLSNCPLLSGRVLGDNGHFDEASLAKAIRWAVAHGARVINMSLWTGAGYPVDPVLVGAVDDAMDAGVVVVLIAGNGSNNDFVGTWDPSANPLAYAFPLAIRVAGVNGDFLNSESNFGPHLADVAAPYTMPVEDPDGSVFLNGGTSFAAPVVAAIAVEMLSVNPAMSPAAVKSCIMATSTPVADLDVPSGGVVDAYKALLCARRQAPPVVRLSVSPPTGGTITDDSRAIQCGSICSASFPSHARVTLTATAKPGYRFAGWRGACSGHTPYCTLTLTHRAHVTGRFAKRAAR